MDKQKSKIVVINSLNNSGIKGLLISIWVLKLGTKEVNIVMIGTDAYYVACKLKEA